MLDEPPGAVALPFEIPALAWHVERACAAAWPARSARGVGAWVAGSSGGGSRRANSASAVAADPPLDTATLAGIAAASRDAGQATIVRVTDMVAGADAVLDAAGFGPAEGRTRTLIQRLNHPHPPRASRADVVIASTADAAWCSARSAWLPHDAAADHHILPTRVAAPAAFVRVVMGGATCSLGYVAITGGVAVIEAVATDPARRGQGHGSTLIAALVDQAARAGATHVALQVEVDNAVAHALYRRVGFATDLYGYHYRRAGDGSRLPTRAAQA